MGVCACMMMVRPAMTQVPEFRTICARLLERLDRLEQDGDHLPPQTRAAAFPVITENIDAHELAAICRVSPSTARRWKSGSSVPPGSAWAAVTYHAGLIDLSRTVDTFLADPDSKKTARNLAAAHRRANRIFDRSRAAELASLEGLELVKRLLVELDRLGEDHALPPAQHSRLETALEQARKELEGGGRVPAVRAGEARNAPAYRVLAKLAGSNDRSVMRRLAAVRRRRP